MKAMYKIRDAAYQDREGILEMSKLIWEGEDYLPWVIDQWLGSTHPLIVAEETETGRIIGLDRVVVNGQHAFFQGLRVHPDCEGQGIGTALSKEIILRALKKGGYVFWADVWHENQASLTLSKRVGMVPQSTLYLLQLPVVQQEESANLISDEEAALYPFLPEHIQKASQTFHEMLFLTAGSIPMGWSCIPELALAHDRWILEYPEGAMMIGSDDHEPNTMVISLITQPGRWVIKAFEHIQQLASRRKCTAIYLGIPIELKAWAEALLDMGVKAIFDDMPWDECKTHILRNRPEFWDRQMAAFQLKKEKLTNFTQVAARCRYGFPQVIESSPVKDEEPFPTLFYLTCPYLRKRLAQWEETGMIGEWEKKMRDDLDLKREMEAAHQAYRLLREARLERDLAIGSEELLTLKSRFLTKGIGGIDGYEGIKCLHLHLATVLGGLKTPMGEAIVQKLRQEEDRLACDEVECAAFWLHPHRGKKS